MRPRRLTRLVGGVTAAASLAIIASAGTASAEAGTRFAPSTTDTGQVYDLVTEYMFNNGNALVSSQDSGQIQQDFFEPAPVDKLYYVKQNDTTFWERFGISADRVALERDTTAPAGWGGNAYDFSPWGSVWMPRSWRVGEETSFSTSIVWFDKNSCQKTGTVNPWAYGRHFLRYQGSFDMGGSLGVQDVIIVDRYHWISDNPGKEEYSNSPEAERFWYARGRGWVRWDHFVNRANVFPTWNSVEPAHLENPGATQTVRFTVDNPNGNSATPNKVCEHMAP